LQKLALLITLEDKCNKQQNQAILFFHWQPKLFHGSDLPQSTDLRWYTFLGKHSGTVWIVYPIKRSDREFTSNCG